MSCVINSLLWSNTKLEYSNNQVCCEDWEVHLDHRWVLYTTLRSLTCVLNPPKTNLPAIAATSIVAVFQSQGMCCTNSGKLCRNSGDKGNDWIYNKSFYCHVMSDTLRLTWEEVEVRTPWCGKLLHLPPHPPTGQRGVYTTSSGMQIAYVSGSHDQQEFRKKSSDGVLVCDWSSFIIPFPDHFDSTSIPMIVTPFADHLW